MSIITRRKFIGISGLGVLSLAGCSSFPFKSRNYGIPPQNNDVLALDSGLSYQLLIRSGDPISSSEQFGWNPDFNALFPIPDKKNEYVLWTNHESYARLLLHGGEVKNITIDHIKKERSVVGGTCIHVVFDPIKKNWSYIKDSSFNRRINGLTKIPFSGGVRIRGAKAARGTLANCAGGTTPWGTVLSGEENYHHFVGEDYREFGERKIKSSRLGWEKFFNDPPEHYGWVVEINPFTGKSKKLIGLGRFAHEAATTIVAKDGRVVVYTGDDEVDQCMYKFISKKPGSLDEGTLYVANVSEGKWIPLTLEHPLLKERFKSQLDILIYCREAAQLVGGTPLDRPEDIEVHPHTKEVFLACTGHIKAGRPFGYIMKFQEKNNDHLSLEFNSVKVIEGGSDQKFACPDNLVFNQAGELFFTSDISGSLLNKGPFAEFGNNGFYKMVKNTKNDWVAHRLISAPRDAELSGPWFSPDFKSLFLSVQHPGEVTKDITKLTSHWPDGGTALPQSAVIVVQGV